MATENFPEAKEIFSGISQRINSILLRLSHRDGRHWIYVPVLILFEDCFAEDWGHLIHASALLR